MVDDPFVRAIPLGGLGQVGGNLMVYETERDMIVVDCGMLFPSLNQHGVDCLIPNINYVIERIEKLRGVIITHGHEDHIGALPLLAQYFPVPVYATGFTLALIKYKFENAGFLSIDTQGTELEILMSGQSLLETSIFGIYIETEFQELYKGQSLFADVDTYLRNIGFLLIDIDRVLMRRHNYSTEYYSRKQISHCHCLYIKPPENIDGQPSESLTNKFEQLLLIAIANEHYDLAREICSIEPSRYLLFEKHGKSLLDELEDYIYSRTQTIKHITRKYNPKNELSDPLYKDRKHRYK